MALDPMLPIVRGALYRDVSTHDTHGALLRVKSVWIDEDESVQIRVSWEADRIDERSDETIDKETFISQIDENIIRVNDDHDAWEWRN